MVLYVGEAVTIKAVATDPLRSVPITDAVAVVDFYAPGKDPKNVPADRVIDEAQVALAYDALLEAYVGFVSTVGWLPGKWTYKVTLSGAYSSWEYGAFTLKSPARTRPGSTAPLRSRSEFRRLVRPSTRSRRFPHLLARGSRQYARLCSYLRPADNSAMSALADVEAFKREVTPK